MQEGSKEPPTKPKGRPKKNSVPSFAELQRQREEEEQEARRRTSQTTGEEEEVEEGGVRRPNVEVHQEDEEDEEEEDEEDEGEDEEEEDLDVGMERGVTGMEVQSVDVTCVGEGTRGGEGSEKGLLMDLPLPFEPPISFREEGANQ